MPHTMRYRERRRVDWDEEIRKTERIRRKGLFISGLGFAVAALFVFGVKSVGNVNAEVSRKIIFALCFMLSMFVLRITLRRRERLRLEREEQQLERMLHAKKMEE